MLMVVVGAGASYDAVPENVLGKTVRELSARAMDWRPPLANDLLRTERPFAGVIERYPACRPLIAALRETSGVGALEDRLAEYERGADEVPARLRHPLEMRFYLRDVLMHCTEAMTFVEAGAGVTNYIGLVRDTNEWTSPATSLSWTSN